MQTLVHVVEPHRVVACCSVAALGDQFSDGPGMVWLRLGGGASGRGLMLATAHGSSG